MQQGLSDLLCLDKNIVIINGLPEKNMVTDATIKFVNTIGK